MLLLALNSATTQTEVALLQGGKTLFEKSWISQKDEAEKIVPAVAESLNVNKFTFKDLEALFVIEGPGHFSGLRIGITIVNVLAFSQKIPIFSCNVFQFLKCKIDPKYRKNTAIILNGGGDYFALMVAEKRTAVLIESSKLMEFLKGHSVEYVFPDLQQKKFAELETLIQNSSNIRLLQPSEIKTFAEAVKEIFKKKLVEQKMIQPVYLKKPHITQSKKQIFT